MRADASFHSGISAKTRTSRVRHSLAISGNIDLPFVKSGSLKTVPAGRF
jgi:hypothetical protein